MVRDGRFWCRIGVSARFAGLVADTLDLLAAQQIPALYERIGQRAGYEQAMSVLLEPAIAHLGEAEHPFDDPERMFNSPLSRGQATGPHFGLAAIFRSLDLIHNSAVAVERRSCRWPPPIPSPSDAAAPRRTAASAEAFAQVP